MRAVPLVDKKSCGMQPYLRYQGGKHKIAKQIVKLFPPHRVYVEPMVGGGSVFLAKCPAEKEVISDVDGNLMGFWRGLKNGEVKRCDLTPNREKFSRLVEKRKSGAGLNPCEYLYVNKISFGGKGTTPDPGAFEKCRGDKAKRCGVVSKNDAAYAQRLRKVAVEQGDFRKVLSKHDGRDTLIYIDPPYQGTSTEGYGSHGVLSPSDVAAAAKRVKGKVVISYNDSKEVKKLFCGRDSGFKCKEIETDYTLNNKGNHLKTKELLITNFDSKKGK